MEQAAHSDGRATVARSVKKLSRCNTSFDDLVNMVVFNQKFDLMILDVFSSLSDSIWTVVNCSYGCYCLLPIKKFNLQNYCLRSIQDFWRVCVNQGSRSQKDGLSGKIMVSIKTKALYKNINWECFLKNTISGFFFSMLNLNSWRSLQE